tara:strand:- start:130 stop:807 length:678 start_codon:yes stop_codon:yes gene_type:complete
MNSYKALERTKETGSNIGLINKGMVPGIIYGKGSEPTKIALENKVLQKLMNTGAFYSTIIDIDINGKVEKILPKQLQYHPVSDRLIHFDFLRVQENTKVNVEIPVEFLNQEKCPGLKKGGVLNTVRRLVELTCNANKIPSKLEFDLVNSEIGDAVKISNISLPEGVAPTISDRDFVIATLVPPTVEVETKTEESTEEVGQETGEAKPDDKKEENKDQKEENKENK